MWRTNKENIHLLLELQDYLCYAAQIKLVYFECPTKQLLNSSECLQYLCTYLDCKQKDLFLTKSLSRFESIGMFIVITVIDKYLPIL